MVVMEMKLLLQNLSQSSSLEELRQAVTALEQHLARCTKQNTHTQRSIQCIYPVLKSVLVKMSNVPVEASMDQLLHLADACFSQCHNCCSDENYLVLMYSYMKKLAASNRVTAALSRGQQLLSVLDSSDPISCSSSTRKDLLLGAGLNVLMCHCKIPDHILGALKSIHTAARAMLQALWQVSDQAVVQHADALCDVLLQLNILVGKEVSCSSDNSSSTTPEDQCVGIVALQQQLFQAVSMSSKAAMLPQLAVEAAAALPKTLRYCSIVSMLAAARQHGGTSSSDTGASTNAFSVNLALLGLKAVLQSLTSKKHAAAACVRGLIAFRPQEQQMEPEASLLVGLLCCCSSNLDLCCSEVNSITAQIQSAVAAVQLQTTASGAAAAAAAGGNKTHAGAAASAEGGACLSGMDAGALDDLTNKVAGISLSGVEASRNSNRNGSSSRAVRKGHADKLGKVSASSNSSGRTSDATGHKSLQLQPHIAAFQIEVAVWCLQQLVDAGAPDDTEIAPLFVTYVTGVINTIVALHSSSCHAQSSSYTIAWGSVARAAAMAAGMLKRLPIGELPNDSASPNSNELRSSSNFTGNHPNPVSQPQQLLQQFKAALQHLIGVRDHSEEPDADLRSRSDCSSSGSRHNRLSSKELQWLSWQLYSCALDKDAATSNADNSRFNSSSKHTAASPCVAAHLLLLAWRCTKMQIRPLADSSCSTGTALQCYCLEAATAPPANVLTLLQQAHAYFNCILSIAAACSAATADETTTMSAQEAQGTIPVVFQHISNVQLVALQTVSVALRHSIAATAQHQAEAEQLQLRLHKVLKMYSRLRCMVGALAESSSSSSNNNKAGRSGTGSRRQRARIQQQESEHLQAAADGWLLQSAAHLQWQQQQQQQQQQSQPGSRSSSSIQEAIPVLYIAWLESKALLSIAQDRRYNGSDVAAAALQELLDQLCRCHTTTGHDAAVLRAATKLLQGMVLCSGGDALDLASISSKSSSNSRGVSSSSDALSALSKACQDWSALLLQLRKSGSCCTTSVAVAPNRASRGAVKGRPETASSGNSDDSSSKSEALAGLDPVGIAQAFARELGADAAAGILMLAAVSHCCLALVQASAAARQSGSIHIATTAVAAECSAQQEPQDSLDPDSACSTDQEAADTAEANSTAMCDAQELYASACMHLHTCAKLFTAMQHAASASTNSSNPLGVCGCFAPEAAVLALHAWHVAGLQGWSSCQAALGEAILLLTPALPAQLQAELHRMQQLAMPLGCDCGLTWLGLLLAPQQLPPLPVLDSSGNCSNSRDSRSSPAGADCAAPANGRLQSAGKMQRRGTAAVAAAPAVAQPCACVTYCGCQLQSRRQAIAAAQQSHSQVLDLHPGARDALQLQQALLLVADCQAASALGDMAAALTSAERAVDLCRGIITAVTIGSNSSSGRVRPEAVLSCIRPLQPSIGSLVHGFAVSLYMSALWLLSEVLEMSGNPNDALRALKQLLKLSAASNCCCFTALAMLKISAIQLKTGDDDGAVATAATAAEYVQQFQQRQKLPPAHDLQQQQQWQQSLLCGYVAAAGLQAEAGCNLVSGQHDAAHQQLTAAIQLLDRSIAAATLEEHHQQQSVCMMLWRVVDLRAKLQLQLVHSLLITQGRAIAVHQLRQALEDLAAASTCSRCNLTAWTAARAALELQLLAWCCPDRPASQPSSTVLQLIGFGSSSSHCNLQAEFACAAAEKDTTNGETAADAVQAATGSKARKASRATSRTTDRTSTRISSGSSSKRSDNACEKSQLPPSDAAGAVDPATWMSQLLMLLPACLGQPLLLRDACCMLRSFLLAHGVLQGAVLMLQLSLGISITQQQLLAACSKLSQAQSEEQQHLACTAEAAEEAPANSCQERTFCAVWQQVQQQLNLQPLLAELATIAKETRTHCSSSGSSSSKTDVPECAVSSQLLLDMFSKLDSIAAGWLQQQLDGLLPSTAVCSLIAARPDASTPFGAAAADDRWHPLVTPAAAALAVQAPASGCSLLVCRMLPASASATDTAGGVQSSMLPLLVLLQPSIQTADNCSVTLHQSLAELSSILSESSASMQHSVTCTTAAQKAKWWKQRLALDARMAALLQQLDEQWLGPWRCLLMQPGCAQAEAAAAAAAAATFIGDYFEFIFEEQPRQLLAQLVAVLLVHLDAISPLERQQAVKDLCQLTQQRADGLHLSKLISGLEDAHAALAAALEQPRQLDAGSAASSSPCHASSSSWGPGTATDMSAAAATAAAAVYVTPAAPKARSRLGALRQGSASAKKPQSRLKAMQRSSRVAACAAADAVTEAGVSSLADMLSHKLQVGGSNKHGACDAGASAGDGRQASGGAIAVGDSSADAAPQPQQRRRQLKHAAGHEGRRVRFAADQEQEGQEHEDLTAADKPVLDDVGVNSAGAVPPSLARHAVRRSRLAVMHTTPTAAPLQAAGDSSSSIMSARVHAHAATASSNRKGAFNADSFYTPAKAKHCEAIATGTSPPQRQQQQRWQRQQCSWVPSVLLLLDIQLQQLPWESLPGLKQQNMYRCPSLSLAAAVATRYKAAQHAQRSHMQSSSSSGSRPTADTSLKQQQHALCQLRLHDGYFLLNPDGDLQATQDTFESWLQQLGLQGVSGTRPAAAHLKAALQSHELFLYFGHGAGEQYVPVTALKQLDRCAAALLMGCSSGRLKQLGLHEPSGAMWGYLLAGCPAAVANLWDVTDRDIDRFAQALIQKWTGGSSSSSDDGGTEDSSNNHGTNLTARRGGCRPSHDGCAQQDTLQRRVVGVAAGSAGLFTAQSAASSGMSAAVAASRQACRLPSLIGAAAVCYGLPAHVDAQDDLVLRRDAM